MIFRQLVHAPGGCASYLVGCAEAGEAVVVDPLQAIGAEEYLLEAADRGLSIRYVVDTHTHADHVSAGRELAEIAGAPYCLGERARGVAAFDFHGLADGDVLQVGRIELRVMETPGHTPDSICLVVTDRGRGDEPWFVLSGDTLFVGDVGRPDLLVGDEALDIHGEDERARLLYASIRERLFSLPDHVEVYPGHFGGSSCGGVNMSGKASSTIAFEKRNNLALRSDDAASFAAFVRETMRPQPANYETVKRRNLGLLADAEGSAGARRRAALAPEQFWQAVQAGAVPVDMRPPLVSAGCHVPGSLLVQFSRRGLEDRLRALLPAHGAYVVVMEPDGVGVLAEAAVRRAGRQVMGHLAGGMRAWVDAGLPVESLPTVTPGELHEILARAGGPAGVTHGNGPGVLDVREPHEYAGGHIPGARNLPHGHAWARAAAELDRDREWYVACQTQTRAGATSSILRRLGFRRITLVLGGTSGWLAEGYPAERS